jgi:hypothetical protein
MSGEEIVFSIRKYKDIGFRSNMSSAHLHQRWSILKRSKRRRKIVLIPIYLSTIVACDLENSNSLVKPHT